MSTLTAFWRTPEFAEFLPYIRVQPAHDNRGGRNRLEVSSKMPLDVLARALAYRGPCAKCGHLISVFRSRAAEVQRGKAAGNVYLAACCPLDLSIPCSRGGAASRAYEVIAALALHVQRGDAEQGGLL